jgi:hypothetical protein
VFLGIIVGRVVLVEACAIVRLVRGPVGLDDIESTVLGAHLASARRESRVNLKRARLFPLIRIVIYCRLNSISSSYHHPLRSALSIVQLPCLARRSSLTFEVTAVSILQHANRMSYVAKGEKEYDATGAPSPLGKSTRFASP